MAHMKLAAALLLALALQPRGAQGVPSCPYTLQLPAGSGVTAAADAASAAGSCDPYAADGAVCDGISVPGGAVLAYGTCALPGAACTGSTLLQLASASGTPLAGVAPVSRVALNSSVAALAKGCVLGVKCSYGAPRSRAARQAASLVGARPDGLASARRRVAQPVAHAHVGRRPRGLLRQERVRRRRRLGRHGGPTAAFSAAADSHARARLPRHSGRAGHHAHGPGQRSAQRSAVGQRIGPRGHGSVHGGRDWSQHQRLDDAV